ncbi:MAG: 5-formyltetrahydrofolate cyclo-ligase [Bacteroidales bacterium]|nr:5-formyltetrahydrofolate cyclo-ligase [Bacteroidales bacterium]
MDKKELRQLVRDAKRAVPFEEKVARSRSIMAKAEELPQFQAADLVLLYWSMDDEVATHEFVERWHIRKTLLLPCVEGNDLLLRPYTGPQCLRPGPQFGIGEPTGPLFEELDKVKLIVVPGVAFDRQRNRLGRGRGFYDRLLKSTPNAFKVGVAFRFQMFNTLPVEPFDVPMDAVVSEDETLI